MGRTFDDYFAFGFVRNPWDWQVSLYFYMLENESHFQHDLIQSMESFEEYIDWRVHEDKTLQKEFFCDNKGNIIIDYIGRLEEIQSDFNEICEKIGIDQIKLPKKRTSCHKHYSAYYNERTKNLVREHFKEDIELFDYEFEEKKRK